MAPEDPVAIVLAGPNGAGKTTAAPAVLRDSLGLADFVNGDAIALGLSAFAPEDAAFAAGRIMLERIRSLASRGQSFAFETTLATRSFAPLLNALRPRYEIHIVFLALPSPDLAVERVRSRVTVGGHHVPEAVVRRRFVRGIQNFETLYRPLASTWIVFDSSSAKRLPIAEGEHDAPTATYDESGWNAFQEFASDG